MIVLLVLTSKGKHMSWEQNTVLLERARQVLEEIESHPSGYDDCLRLAIKRNDLEDVKMWVTRLEAELSEAHFRNNNIEGVY